MQQVFFAYPNNPSQIGQVIESTSKEINKSGQKIVTWKAMDVTGTFIVDGIVDNIQDRVFVADITRLNFNVVYELGFAIGSGRKILITKNSSIQERHPTMLEVGIFDTIGYATYANSEDLQLILTREKPNTPFKDVSINKTAPVYILETKKKTDFSNRILARVKKARLNFRSFDPNESPRLSALDAISQVAQSNGVIVSLLSKDDQDNEVHNIRAAFIAGLATGMKKVSLFLQFGYDTTPIDVRDFVSVYGKVNDVDGHVGTFATDVVDSMQSSVKIKKLTSTTLEKIEIGASAAENEMRTLKNYYLKTDAYNKAMRGEAQLVVGRKGSGKSAIFLQIRDNERNKNDNIVLDLKPDGYKLIKFKEQVLDFLEEGTFQHTIMAFWEYILLLEICHKCLESDKTTRFSHPELADLYKKLEKLYAAEDYLTEGDFSERMSRLMANLEKHFKETFGKEQIVRLSAPQVTQLLYQTDIKQLKDALTAYLSKKKKIWLLFDNIDKGWPAGGLKHEDLIIIRALIDATRKIQRHFEKYKVDVLPIIFLRNDVYELLVNESSDRQKEQKVLLDWTDPDLLAEIIKLRLLSNEDVDNGDFQNVWRRMCTSLYKGEDSFQFLVERSLMRPRFLLNLINHCKSIAVNLNHFKIMEEDIKKGLDAYSADLLTDINLEMRDVFPNIENVLFGFIDSHSELSQEEVKQIVEKMGTQTDECEKVIDLLLWYGFLGIKHDSEVRYIYSTNYSISVLKALIAKKHEHVIFVINPGFYPALLIKH